MRKAYLAGPEVFLPNAREIGAGKKAICAANGLDGLFPLDKDVPAGNRKPGEVAFAIYVANIELLDRADLVIANLTPFRGPSMDVGTAFEVGFASARGLPVFGYTKVAESLLERVLRLGGGTRPRATPPLAPTDALGMEIEDFGFFENLMIEVPVRKAAGEVVAGSVPPDGVFTDLSVFERCVKRAVELGLSSAARQRRAR